MKVKPAERTKTVSEYYFASKLRQIDMMRKSGVDVINLGIGSPDLPPHPDVIRKLKDEAERPDVHGYQSYSGVQVLRNAMAAWYKKYFAVELNPENEILPLIGSKEGIMHITMAFVNPGDVVLVPDPGYPSYSSAARLAGGTVKFYDLTAGNSWMPDFARIEEAGMENVKLMWVNYPNMPTGQRGSRILFERLIRFAGKHNILIVNDNPYSFILNREHISILYGSGAKNVSIELNSLSKSHNMAGWRIGMAAGNAEIISEILKVKSNMDSGMFLPVQLAAAEALGAGESWYTSLNDIYRRRRKIAGDLMNILGCQFDKRQTGLFLWGEVSKGHKNGQELSDRMLEQAHVFITPGFIFGKNGEKYVRISLCSDEVKLAGAKERIKSVIN